MALEGLMNPLWVGDSRYPQIQLTIWSSETQPLQILGHMWVLVWMLSVGFWLSFCLQVTTLHKHRQVKWSVFIRNELCCPQHFVVHSIGCSTCSHSQLAFPQSLGRRLAVSKSMNHCIRCSCFLNSGALSLSHLYLHLPQCVLFPNSYLSFLRESHPLALFSSLTGARSCDSTLASCTSLSSKGSSRKWC